MKQSTHYNISLPESTDLASIDVVTDAIDSAITKTYEHATTSNPHNINKSTVGLGNVDNVKQAPNTHLTDANAHNSVLAPKNHSSDSSIYGVGTNNLYGHLKLSDSITSTSSASDGVAATPKAVKDAIAEAINKSDSMFYEVYHETIHFSENASIGSDILFSDYSEFANQFAVTALVVSAGNIKGKYGTYDVRYQTNNSTSTKFMEVKISSSSQTSPTPAFQRVYMLAPDQRITGISFGASSTSGNFTWDAEFTLIGFGIKL